MLCFENLIPDPAILSVPAEVKECEEDVKAECEEVSSGTVVYCVVPTKDDLKGMGEADVGKCLVLFEDIAAAKKAFAALNGRLFDGNAVRASFRPVPST